MFKESSFLIKIKATADVLLLLAIIITTRLIEFQYNIFSDSLFTVIVVNVISWLIIARAFGLYGDLRMKPISIEWVMFLKAFGIFTLVNSFIFFFNYWIVFPSRNTHSSWTPFFYLHYCRFRSW